MNTAKNLQISYLLDFYGEMLTDKQREMIELYYNDDLSLSEISEEQGITRQGVRDAIKRAEQQLVDMEERLGLARKFTEMQKGLTKICDETLKIAKANREGAFSQEIEASVCEILDTAKTLYD